MHSANGQKQRVTPIFDSDDFTDLERFARRKGLKPGPFVRMATMKELDRLRAEEAGEEQEPAA